jgi:YD repeat-containing protein
LPSGEGKSDAASRSQDANGLVTSETDFKGAITPTTGDVVRRLPTSVTHAVSTLEAQTTTTMWHATFSVPVLVTESGRSTAWTYDVQGNPLSQTITDTVTSKTHVWQWTYNAQGLAAIETAPNGAVTSYEYDTLGGQIPAFARYEIDVTTAQTYEKIHFLTASQFRRLRALPLIRGYSRLSRLTSGPSVVA